jgi:ABC-2 type transport system ATP-binding protein
MLCDRVCGLKLGTVVLSGTIRELVKGDVRTSEITLENASEALVRELTELGESPRTLGGQLVLDVAGDTNVRAVLERALAQGAHVSSVIPKRETLEQIFVRRAL